MADDDRTRWDEVYHKRATRAFPPPDPLLFEYTLHVPPNKDWRALDLAGGVGQNGLWLAQEGYITDVVDISRVALSRGQQEAQARGVRHINFIPVDLEARKPRPDTYDLICVFRYLNRDVFKSLRAALRPGGRIIYHTFNVRYVTIAPKFNAAYLLQLGELQGFFADWHIIYADDEEHISEIVAIKPD